MHVLSHALGDGPITAQQAAARDAWKGRGRTMPGSRVDNLAALGKAITLCQGTCCRKFDALHAGYALQRSGPFRDGVIADCDGCLEPMVPAEMYLKAAEA